MVRKNYEGKGLTVKEGETVQVIAVMPDGCHWKVATINPPFRDGLIPADLLCPESSRPIEKPQSPSDSVGDSVIFDGESTENRQPLKVLPRFTKPPSVKKPIPKARAAAPRSPTGVEIVNMTFRSLLTFKPMVLRAFDLVIPLLQSQTTIQP